MFILPGRLRLKGCQIEIIFLILELIVSKFGSKLAVLSIVRPSIVVLSTNLNPISLILSSIRGGVTHYH
jgi:hypothetical protein